MASCWVMVEPPCDTPRRLRLATRGAHETDRIDAEVAVEAAVLDREERLRQIRRHFLERQRGAVHLAAVRDQLAVGADDLDRGRPPRNFERLDRRQIGGDPDDRAAARRSAPTVRAPRTSRTAGAAASGCARACGRRSCRCSRPRPARRATRAATAYRPPARDVRQTCACDVASPHPGRSPEARNLGAHGRPRSFKGGYRGGSRAAARNAICLVSESSTKNSLRRFAVPIFCTTDE